jgi:outer membrane protein
MKSIVVGSLLLISGINCSAQAVYSLADCRKMATTHNSELKIATEQVNVASSMKKAAKTLYLPSISATGGYVHNQKNLSLLGQDQFLPVYAYKADGSIDYSASWNNSWTSYGGQMLPTDANGVPFNPSTDPDKIQWKYKTYIPKDAFDFDTRNTYVGAVTLTQPLFTGGKIVQMNRMAESGIKLAKAQQKSEVAETIVKTDVAYWRVVSLANKVRLADSYVELLQRLSKDIEKSIAIGVATKSDGLTVKVKLNDAEMSLMQAQNGLSLSRMALCQLCGLALNSTINLADENLEQLPVQAETNLSADSTGSKRYELNALEEAVKIAESTRKVAVSRFLPNAALVAGYTVSNPNLYSGYEKKFGGQYQIGVVVNVPIYHFGERIHTLQAANGEKKMAEIKLDDAREMIELDIAQAQFKYAESTRKAELTTSNKEKAEENLHYAIVGYEAGTIAASALMEAQTTWLKASTDQIDASIDVRLTAVQLEKALGNLYNVQ